MSSASSKSLGTVLVVGGCGFLGSHLVEQLLNFASESFDDSANSKSASGLVGIPHGKSLAFPHSSAYSFPKRRGRYPTYTNTYVHVLDLKCLHNQHEGALYHEADITSPEAVLAVFKEVKPDLVINTVSPGFESPKPILYKVNVEGAKILLEVAGGVHGSWGGKCKAFVHTSSCSVIHDTQSNLIRADERWPLVRPNPREYYSETKADAEVLVLESNRKYGDILTCAIRPAGIIGERDSIVTRAQLEHAQFAPRWQLRMQLGGGENLFDYTYVGNVGHGILLAAERLLQTAQRVAEGKAAPLDYEKIDGEVFIVTNDSPVSFWHAARYLMALLGKPIDPSEVIAIPDGLGMFLGGASEFTGWLTGRKPGLNRARVKYSCISRYYSCEKAKLRLGYRPVVGLEEALIRSTKSYLENFESRNPSESKKTQ